MEMHCYGADDGIGSYPKERKNLSLAKGTPVFWITTILFSYYLTPHLKDGPSRVELCDSTRAKILRETIFPPRGAGKRGPWEAEIVEGALKKWELKKQVP